MAREQMARRRSPSNSAGPSQPGKRLNEIGGLALFGLGIVVLLALLSYSPTDLSRNVTGPQLKAHNWIGPVGAFLADELYQGFGYIALVIPFVLIALAWWRLIYPRPPLQGVKLLGLGLVIMSLMGLLALAESCALTGAFHSGGLLGHILTCNENYGLTQFLNFTGTAILLALVLISGLILATPFSLVGMIVHLTPREMESGIIHVLAERFRAWRQEREALREQHLHARVAEKIEEKEEKKEERKVEPPALPPAKPVIQVRSPEPKLAPKPESKREERKGRTTLLGLTESLHEVLPPHGSQKKLDEVKDEEDWEEETIVQPAVKTPVKETARETVKSEPESPAPPAPIEEPLPSRVQPNAAGNAAAASSLNASAKSAAKSPAGPTANPTDAAPGAWRTRLNDWRNRGRNTPLDEEEATAEPVEPIDEFLPEPSPAPPLPAPPARVRYSDLPRSERTGERTIDEMVAAASVHRATAEDESPAKPIVPPRPVVRAVSEFKAPTTDMLTAPDAHSELADTELNDRARQLAEKCREFNVAGVVKQISPGPVVTTFEFKLDPGVKYGRVTSLVDDLCLGLKAESIRIDRIPGKSTVGIEVPNQRREVIRLREVIESRKFTESTSKLTLALGQTIDGANYVADLAKMPHLLIAGATGAGKSVALNTILASILYKASPDEVKLILIDPKRLELGLYADIPHLLTPIVTDPKRASYALKWAVSEMENRYKHLASFGVRNIDQYNHEVGAMVDRNLAEDNDEMPRPLPYIVVIIDELADLMMVSSRDVEESITRLAQMARAVGIHLVLATQRPSTDVITGLIKANFPSRISFRVSSKVDSRVIIDANGAEGLLGQGDMLFLPPGTSRLIRVHGAFVDEKEVKRLADFIRAQRRPVYDDRVQMSDKELEGEELAEMRRDEKYEEALRIVFEMGRASTSVLQRRLRIGYGRAASIIDMMHREGAVGPEDGSKPRQVLVSPDDRAGFLERLAQMREEAP
jgi:S-DNA-T family DNA segregation ATPase FtsK/SpoIIIE